MTFSDRMITRLLESSRVPSMSHARSLMSDEGAGRWRCLRGCCVCKSTVGKTDKPPSADRELVNRSQLESITRRESCRGSDS